MIKTIAALLRKQSTLHAEVGLDHIELSKESLIIGLQVAWYNHTVEPVEISGVSIKVHDKGKKEEPVELIYHGRFVRIPFQKSITKIAGANSFPIKPGSYLMEGLRFMTSEINDLKDGVYTGELHSDVVHGTYLHNFDFKAIPLVKYRTCGPESAKEPDGTSTSSIFERARRLA